MDDDTPLVIGADVKVSDRFDADDELRMSFPASGRAAYFSRADVERLRDHLTALLTEPTPSVELVEGREYRLLPGARCSGSSVPESCFFGVTRVTLETKPELDGDVQVTFLDGPPSYVGSRGWWVLSRFLAPLDEPKPVKVEVGKEYRLLPGARCRMTDGTTLESFHGKPVTRVEVISEADSVGDYMVRALDVSPGSEHYVSARYLAPLDEPVAEIAGKASLADIAQAARETGQMYARAARSYPPHSNLYRHIGEAFATFADKLEGKPE